VVRIIAYLSLMQSAVLFAAAAGCTSSSAGRSTGIQSASPLGQNAKPNPIKQFTAKVGESSIAKSISKTFNLASTKKPKPMLRDPVSLAEKPKPPDADWYVSLGDLRVQEHDNAGAREMYHKALSMKSHHLGALLGLARLFDRQGQLDRAEEHYLEATKYHPKESMAFNDLGLCYARQGKYDQAAAALDRAIELQPDRVLYRNNIATVYVAQGRVNDALAHLTDAHGVAVAHYNIGFLLNKRGQQRQALEQFALAVQADPKLTAAQEWVDSLSAQLNGGQQAPFYTASETQLSETSEPETAEPEQQGPLLGPSSEPAGENVSSEVSVPDFGGVESREQPVNQLRPSETDEISPQEALDALPSQRVETPAGVNIAEQSPLTGNESAEPGANASTRVGEHEARLQYLPPVSSSSSRPNRY
jgi:tetratricopeptide (TPR) repeat protein